MRACAWVNDSLAYSSATSSLPRSPQEGQFGLREWELDGGLPVEGLQTLDAPPSAAAAAAAASGAAVSTPAAAAAAAVHKRSRQPQPQEDAPAEPRVFPGRVTIPPLFVSSIGMPMSGVAARVEASAEASACQRSSRHHQITAAFHACGQTVRQPQQEKPHACSDRGCVADSSSSGPGAMQIAAASRRSTTCWVRAPARLQSQLTCRWACPLRAGVRFIVTSRLTILLRPQVCAWWVVVFPSLA